MNISSMRGGAPSAEMMKEMQQKMFAKVDANKDGGIDKSEMTNFAKQAGRDTSKVDEMFQAADSDGNGSISESENSALMDKIGEQMKARFSEMQSNVDSTDSPESTDDVVTKMMEKILERSEQSGGTDHLKQLLASLSQQVTSYGSTGAKETTALSSLFTQLA